MLGAQLNLNGSDSLMQLSSKAELRVQDGSELRAGSGLLSFFLSFFSNEIFGLSAVNFLRIDSNKKKGLKFSSTTNRQCSWITSHLSLLKRAAVFRLEESPQVYIYIFLRLHSLCIVGVGVHFLSPTSTFVNIDQ